MTKFVNSVLLLKKFITLRSILVLDLYLYYLDML